MPYRGNCRGRRQQHGHHGHRGYHGGYRGGHHGGYSRFFGSGDINEFLRICNYGIGGYDDQPSGGANAPANLVGQCEPKPDPSHQNVLQVKNVNFNVAANVKRHHTDEYDITQGTDPRLVVRRGQEFTIQVNFSRAYNQKEDDLRLVFQIGTSS